MVANYFQQGLPEALEKKATVLMQDPITFAWKFEDIRPLFEWLTFEDNIIDSIYVFEIKNNVPAYIKNSWLYIGDRSNNFRDSKEYNRLQSLAYIENLHLKNPGDLLYDVLFESTEDWDEIRTEFFNRAIIAGGVLAYIPDHSLNIIERCRELGKKILAIEALIINNQYTQPQDDYILSGSMYDEFDPSEYLKIYHVKKNSDIGHWEEAKQYVRDRADNGWVFEIAYQK
jgi:hypothetical protein